MIDFTLYPNMGGNLGEKKVQIPDGVTTFWPDGDALVGNFIYKDGKLSGFVDTKALIANDAKSTIIPYDFVKSEFENVREDSVKFNLGDRCKNFTLKLMPKYKGCKNVYDIKAIDENYIENDIVDGVWSKELSDLIDAVNMFKDCKSLTSFKTDMKSLTTGTSMFNGCSNLVYFNGDLSSLKDSWWMFEGTIIKSFTSKLGSLNVATSMFRHCSTLETFSSDLITLTNGDSMFQNCSNLSNFECKSLESLTKGNNMFNACSSLTSFDFKLSSIIEGVWMFAGCSNLSTFKSDLSSLINGNYMFSNCVNLEIFKSSSLSSLTNGYCMFSRCKLTSFDADLRNLKNGNGFLSYCPLNSFNSDLSSLTNGWAMFLGSKLDTQSLKNIADTINNVTSLENENQNSGIWKIIHIGIGNTTPTEEENIYLTQIHNKGWEVYVNGTGNAYVPTDGTSLIPIDGEQNLNPIPFWAKPVPSTQEEANYVDENGNYYNILGGQFIYVNDPESYGMFISEEDAAANMRLTKIEKDI